MKQFTSMYSEIKKKGILYLVFSIVHLSAQNNLVPNPSFDVYTNCPTTQAQVGLASPWFIPTSGTSDFYHSCATLGSGVNIPGPNQIGSSSSYAHSGSGMAGLFHEGNVTFDAFIGSYREYIAVRLTTPLITNKTYYVTFFVKLADSCIYAGNVSMLIAKDSISKNTFDTISATPQINNVSNSFIKSKTQWTKISGSFISNGTEKFVYIGSFKAKITNDTFFVGPGSRAPNGYPDGLKLNSAYYYVDDVCISSDPQYCNITTGVQSFSNDHPIQIFPNPSSSQIKIVTGTSENINSIELIDVHGKVLKVFDGINSPAYVLEISSVDNGMYFIVIKLNSGDIRERIVKD